MTESHRTATKVLDFLGDVGGFQGALLLIFGFFGEAFAGSGYVASFANDLYRARKTQEELDSDPKKKRAATAKVANKA